MTINPIFLIPIITGPIFLVLGYILLKHPPKKINWWYGYRTAGSMKSQERWDFAQTFSGREMMRSGGVLFIVSLPGWLLKFDINEAAGVITGLGISLLFILIPLYRTEKELNKRFTEL